MNESTRKLHDLGQSLWLDGMHRSLLRDGSLLRCMRELSITGVVSNPAGVEQAIEGGAYDDSIRVLAEAGLAGEELFFELALVDLTQAADLLRPLFDASAGAEGWVSMAVSPLLADNTAHTIHAASKLFERAAKHNLFIQIPGTPEGVRAVEEVIFDGVPVHVTGLFSPAHYQAAAGAYLRGIERRLQAGLDPGVASIAAMSVAPWDTVVKAEIASPFHNRLGLAMAMRSYRAQRELLASDSWLRLAAAGAQPQRLLWADTAVQDPAAPDVLYVQALASPGTIVSLSQETLQAFADHGRAGQPLPADGGYADAVLEEFRREGVDEEALAQRLQRDAVEACATSWHAMLSIIREKCAPLATAGAP